MEALEREREAERAQLDEARKERERAEGALREEMERRLEQRYG